MKKHFTVSPKLSNRRRVTASTMSDNSILRVTPKFTLNDEILITEDFCNNLCDILEQMCNCTYTDARQGTKWLRDDIGKVVSVAEIRRWLPTEIRESAMVSSGSTEEDFDDWVDEMRDLIPAIVTLASE